MAAEFTLSSNKYDGRYMKLVCKQTSNGSAANTSTIKWTLSTVGGSAKYYTTGPTKVIINGSTVYSKSRVDWSAESFPASVGSVSGELTVSHTSTGTKSIDVSFSTAIYTSTVSTYSDTWTLDAIPRYGTLSHSVNTKTETSIKMNWSSDKTIDGVWYSKDDGATWVWVVDPRAKSGSYTVSGLTANTTYKIKTRIKTLDSQLKTDSSALSVATYDYPHCTDSPNFVLGDPVTLKFYNPLDREFNFYIIGNGTQIDVEYHCSSDTYTGVNNTSSSVPYLYATIPNSKSGTYKVKVVYGSSTKTRDNGNTYTIKENECYPNFSTFAYKDTNTTVTNVTGNNQIIVKGLSTINVEIPVAYKMTTKHSATPLNYTATIGNITKTVAYSSTASVSVDMGGVSTSETARINVTAYDSRKMPKMAYKDITVYDYYKPVVNVSAKRINNFEAETTLKVSGTYSPLTISGTDKNAITKVAYRYRETEGTWGGWTTLTTTLASGKFTCNDVILSLDNAKSYEFEVLAYDKLSTTETTAGKQTADVSEGIPIFMISTNQKTCYINNDEVVTKNYILNALHPIDSVVCVSTNTNPKNIYGGEWVLIDKGFESTSAFNKNIVTPSTNVTVTSAYLSRGANTIRIRLELLINSTMTDTALDICTLNWGAIGVTGLHAGLVGHTAYSDVANGGIVYTINNESGLIQQNDIFDTTQISTGSTFHLDFTFVVDFDRMLDNACDKFYFKRI